MSFDSLSFMLFFPIVILLYYVLPQKYRRVWLLISSYYFYICWDVKYAVVLLGITYITYIAARIMNTGKRKLVLTVCIIINLVILGSFKYLGFVISNLNKILEVLGIHIVEADYSIMVPLGISFYMLQALGYVIDVYRGVVQVETNFLNYALYVSFFPTMPSGPIERSTNLLRQIQKGTDFSYDGVKKGLLMMGYGYFEKILIANKIAGMVNNAYEYYLSITGATLALAVVLYGIQIYADFSGYSHIAIGAAKVLGFDLKNNFRQPYFACSIKEFWQRWHISLSSWLRDYVYIPFGGSRKGSFRTYCNLMITFIVSAIWHGAGWKYIVWGGLHGIYQIIEKVTFEFRNKVFSKIEKKQENCLIRVFRIFFTFGLVDFAWLFFGAPSIKSAVVIIYRIITEFQMKETIKEGYHLEAIGEEGFLILIVCIAVVFIIDLIHEKNISITEWLAAKHIVFRWIVYLVVALTLLSGIIYNYGVDASTFIYAQF